MKVLVNATTLVIGGGVQVAASFIKESIADPQGIEWCYALSPQVAEELASLGAMPDHADVFQVSPARDKPARARLLSLESRLSPDAVFTVFGPAYVRFISPHLCGVAVGWVTHSTRLAFSTLPGLAARAKTFLTCLYKGYWLRAADRWVVEAENARQGMHKRVRVPLRSVDVVPNTCAAIFTDANVPDAELPDASDLVRLLLVSAYYAHKDIEIIPQVAAELTRLAPDRRFEFTITLPPVETGFRAIEKQARALGVESMIRNVGRVSLKEAIELYRSTHICFMPSLLETFSASYPEAMATGRPIVTTDLDFAHAVCGSAATYFAPSDSRSAAERICALLASPERWSNSIAEGRRVLAQLPNARTKYKLYVEAIQATARGA